MPMFKPSNSHLQCLQSLIPKVHICKNLTFGHTVIYQQNNNIAPKKLRVPPAPPAFFLSGARSRIEQKSAWGTVTCENLRLG